MLWEKTEAPRRAAILSHYGPLRSPLYPGALGLSRVFLRFLAPGPHFSARASGMLLRAWSSWPLHRAMAGSEQRPLDGKSRHICGVFLLSATIFKGSKAGGDSGFAGFLRPGRRVAGQSRRDVVQAANCPVYHFGNPQASRFRRLHRLTIRGYQRNLWLGLPFCETNLSPSPTDNFVVR